jgi:hypothetical protein
MEPRGRDLVGVAVFALVMLVLVVLLVLAGLPG